jgi:hypothetical protein
MMMTGERWGGEGGAHIADMVSVISDADVRVKCRRRRRKRANEHPVNAPMKRFQQKFPAMLALTDVAKLPIPSA